MKDLTSLGVEGYSELTHKPNVILIEIWIVQESISLSLSTNEGRPMKLPNLSSTCTVFPDIDTALK